MIKGLICECKRCNKEFVIKIQDIEPDDISYFNNAYCNSCKKQNKCIEKIKGVAECL